MNAGDWERIKDIFHVALETPSANRAAFVLRATEGQAEWRAQVESLLVAHEASADFLETPALALPGGPAQTLTGNTAFQRTRVGPYRLLEEIGRGGMGTVYLAARDDGQFAQRVAIKLVNRGMDSEAILSRFRHERQILAALDHPNIARLLDGGTTNDGLPYFVMEYVPGRSIRDYCAAQDSGITERIALFRKVCAAVQYAHQNLIVHRDIKSSNIIVTDDGVPKLLDFGIAKLLRPAPSELGNSDDATAHTETISAMTPEYASPEQLRGESVTTATDVYSLGVLLYELLAGQRPFAASGLRPDELVRAVCETDPMPPSLRVNGSSGAEWQRKLRGDLDAVVLMAMRKEPQHRYSSVERFSDDLGRFLSNLPVLAERSTWRYRAGKYAARHRTALAFGALLATTLIGGLAATIWQAQVARTERLRAERRFAEVRSLATTFLFDVHDEIASLPGSTPARARLVKRGLEALDGLVAESKGDTLLERELAVAYQRLGLVQGNSYNANLGDSKAALKSYETSVSLLTRSTDTTSNNAQALHELANAYRGYADLLGITGDLATSMQHLKRSLAARLRAVALDTGNVEFRRALADLYFSMGDTFGGAGIANIGDTKSATESYQQSIEVRKWLEGRMPTDAEVRGGLANAMLNLGSLQLSLDDTTGARQLQDGVAILEKLTAENPNDANRRTNLLSGYLRLRRPLADAGRFTDALKVDQQVLAMLKDMVAADPQNTLLLRNLGVTYNTLAFDLLGAGQAGQAVEQHRTALALVERLRAADPASAEFKQDLAFTRTALGDALREARQHAQAIAAYESSLPVKLELLKSEPENPRHSTDLAIIFAGRGASRVATDDLAGAEQDFDRARPLAEGAAAKPDATAKTRNTVAELYSRIGDLHMRRAQSTTQVATRSAACRDANIWYGKSLVLWKAQAAKRELNGANRGQPTAVSAAMAACAG